MLTKRCLTVFWFVVCFYFWRRRVKRGVVFKSVKRLDGKTVLITGGNVGIGKATAIEFAKRGARVVIASRNVQKSETAKREIVKLSGNRNVSVMHLDLEDFASISSFVEKFNQNETTLHFLINNAGVLGIHGLTQYGYHRVFAINHFGPFLLTNLLMAKLRKQSETSPVRVINIASMVYWWYNLDFNAICQDDKSAFFDLKIYCQSKLANIYFTKELSKRLKGFDINVFSLHPGLIKSEIGSDSVFSRFPWNVLYNITSMLTLRESFYGTQTVMHCSLDQHVTEYSGDYFNACKRVDLWKVAKDEAASTKLWVKSVAVTKDFLNKNENW